MVDFFVVVSSDCDSVGFNVDLKSNNDTNFINDFNKK